MAGQTQTTPGGSRRANRPQAHVPYNDRPKEVGTRTGHLMPRDVPLDADGFEDASAFFKSPAGTEARVTNRSIGTVFRSRFTNTAGGKSGGVVDTPAPPPKRGRLSALAGGSDDEDGSNLGEGLLLEDDDVLAGELSSPGPYFTNNDPPSVTLPKKSRLPPASPSIEYDSLPTPQRRKSRLGNPNPSRPSTTYDTTAGDDMDTALGELIDDELGADEASASQALGMAPTPSTSGTPHGRKSRKSAATSVGDLEEPREEGNRLSLVRGKSRERVPDSDESDGGDDDMGEGTSFAYDGMSMGDDDQFEDANGGMMDDDGDVALEEEAVARESGDDEDEDGEEEDEEGGRTPPPKPRGRPPKSKPASKEPRKRVGSRQATEQIKTKQRIRLSRMGNEGGEDGYSGDFTIRRSGRKHFAPLKYWLGEKFEYASGPGLAVIAEVVRTPTEHVEPLGAKRKRSGRSQSVRADRNGRAASSMAPPEEEGWDDNTEPIGLVKDYTTEQDIERRIAYPQSLLDPREVKDPKKARGSMFKYQKVFGEDQFIAAGVVYIPIGGTKPSKLSKDNSYVFYVIRGAVQVAVHKTSFVMAPGAMFMVPRGNNYKIVNISQTSEAELFFAQARKTRANEQDDAAYIAMQERSRARSESQAHTPAVKKGRRSLASVADEEGSGSEEETPRTKSKARRK